MPIWELKDQTAIAGVGNSPFGRRLMRSPTDLAADVAMRTVLSNPLVERLYHSPPEVVARAQAIAGAN